MQKYILIIITTALILSLILCLVLFVYIRRQNRELNYINGILKEINAGNRNRKILLDSDSILADIGFGINLLLQDSQDTIIALQKAEEAEKALMTSLSHDIRTPLTTLIGYLDAVHTGITDAETRESYVETARQKAYALKNYVDTLFDWFKLSSGEEILEPLPCDMAELTRNILEDWIVIFEEKHISYEIDIPESLIELTIDRKAYARILNNLIQNSLKHSQAAKIGISLKKEKDVTEISVSDNGVGISPSYIKHIFERFYKCDKSRTDRGSGIGLNIVQQLVIKSGGNITVKSEPFVRTTFLITFGPVHTLKPGPPL